MAGAEERRRPGGCNRKFTGRIWDTLHSDTVKAIPFLDAAKVQRYARRMDTASPEQRQALDRQVMQLASTIVLHDRMRVAG